MKLVTGQVYHVLNKSIAGYRIFNNDSEFNRFLETSVYYQSKNSLRFSDFKEHKNYHEELVKLALSKREKIVEIIAYCLMLTHFHFILKQLKDNGISKFLNDTLNSYTRFFNARHKREGPLWAGKTKKVLVETDEQLIHLTRYIHINPTTAYIVDKPEEWKFSSYMEYLNKNQKEFRICKFDDLMDINPDSYKEFAEDRIGYQRDLKKIKDLLLE